MALTPSAIMRQAFNTFQAHAETASAADIDFIELHDKMAMGSRQLIATLRQLGILPPLAQGHAEDQEWYAHLSAYRTAHARHRDELKSLNRELVAAAEAWFPLVERMYRLFAQAKAELGQSPGYQQLLLRQQSLEQNWRYADESYAEIRDECVGKLALFKADPRYEFLRARQFGTEHYRQGRLARLLDQWLAKQIGYHRNRENELILLEMQSENERRKGELEISLDDCRQQLEVLRNAAGEQDEVRRARIEILLLSKQVDDLLWAVHTESNTLHALGLCLDEHGSKIFESLNRDLQYKSHSQIAELLAALPGTTDAATLRTAQAHLDQLNGLREQRLQLEQNHQTHTQSRIKAFDLLRASRNFLFSDCTCDFDCMCACHTCACLEYGRVCSCPKCRKCGCGCVCRRYGEAPLECSYDNQSTYQETLKFEELAQSHILGHVGIGALVKRVRLHKRKDDPT